GPLAVGVIPPRHDVVDTDARAARAVLPMEKARGDGTVRTPVLARHPLQQLRVHEPHHADVAPRDLRVEVVHHVESVADPATSLLGEHGPEPWQPGEPAREDERPERT